MAYLNRPTDRLIEEALREKTHAAAPAGLHDRVMRRVRIETRQQAERAWLAQRAAGAVAVAVAFLACSFWLALTMVRSGWAVPGGAGYYFDYLLPTRFESPLAIAAAAGVVLFTSAFGLLFGGPRLSPSPRKG
jgi:hypothetical protein